MDLWAMSSSERWALRLFPTLMGVYGPSISVNIVRFIDHGEQQMTLNRTELIRLNHHRRHRHRAKNRFIDNSFFHLWFSIRSLVLLLSLSSFFTFDSIVLICLKHRCVRTHNYGNSLWTQVICAHDTHTYVMRCVRMLHLNVNTNNIITIIIGDMHVNGMEKMESERVKFTVAGASKKHEIDIGCIVELLLNSEQNG